MTRYTNCSVSQFVCRNSGNRMSWSNKLEMLLKNFNLRSPDEGDCKVFFVGEEQVGVIRADIWKHLLHYPSVFQYDKSRERVTLNPEWRTYDERSEKFDNVLRELRTKEIFSTLAGWRDECYDVSSKFGDVPVMKMERSATCLFGIKRCGVHVNGYVKNIDGSKCLWIQKRAYTKPTWPGKLDNMVSGGFAVGMTILECVRKEAQEEASLPDDLLNAMIPVGTVSFMFEDDRGIFPETLFVFDIELPVDFVPINSDNEVESFHLYSIEELKKVIVTDDFKLTSSLVTLDFLVRHGYLNCDEEPNYIKLLETCHSPLHYLHIR
ncbi:nudix hydrolase 24, chloroplastic-like isoform X2 [Stegodyphus dumicola]|uniref:nudix hydrolase 24, chloroplastic-like isoform X2 n=1 Tax=Stegodyphus dumicola TaxID=202533 RepID=UPI0015AED201|nr:nudix hydrolase 24, chloroplastic-like isoform X2 [Stegodyphus dumicola]